MRELNITELGRSAQTEDDLEHAVHLADDQCEGTWLTRNGERVAAIVPEGTTDDLDWWECRAQIVVTALRQAIASLPAGDSRQTGFRTMLAGVTGRYGYIDPALAEEKQS